MLKRVLTFGIPCKKSNIVIFLASPRYELNEAAVALENKHINYIYKIIIVKEIYDIILQSLSFFFNLYLSSSIFIFL